ncbi:hypothetical protein N7462_002689 [Penicillium macrosclerotiorum]|uniref:uncharacterized protein n=1 Tax=Penicillium macrosclerotiorum TaxID=303699 RepID=UPI002547B3E2|nr:uncharacterized protein N7462_002689 [Penicillium macrosclerotiorum]KAJ5693266.1 hypothetical protein N7462_002689 [Penicillium macrosclerotiorum]
MTNFKIQIISDTVCPWCFVGYRRLLRAITAHRGAHPDDTFSLNWSAFYLNPDAKRYPGINKQDMYNRKFGAERAAAMFTRLMAVGEADGIAFRFGGKTGSTRDSHRLLWFAAQEEKAQGEARDAGVVGGLQTRVAENLFQAYFEEEKNITDAAVLLEAAVQAGMDEGAVQKFLDSEDGGDAVDAEALMASRSLVTGVPYFSLQEKYSVEGADEPETFLELFGRIKEEEEK